MSYEKLFDWKKLEKERGKPEGGVAYYYDDALELAVNVALATGRPLLLSGDPGSGKSTLAADVAWKLNRRFYPSVVTSRTQGQDLQWTFDAVGRLADANTNDGAKKPVASFVQPGVLWRAFEPKSAAEHGKPFEKRAWGDAGEHAVVLLDEIDKADPDVPNDLLVVLDQKTFTVAETSTPVKAPDGIEVLVVMSTNGERDLPPAFLRRCITHRIELSEDDRRDRMTNIARRHFAKGQIDDALLESVVTLFGKIRASASDRKLRQPSTAELIDALRACRRLKITNASDSDWESILTAALWKEPGKPALPNGLDGAATSKRSQ